MFYDAVLLKLTCSEPRHMWPGLLTSDNTLISMHPSWNKMHTPKVFKGGIWKERVGPSILFLLIYGLTGLTCDLICLDVFGYVVWMVIQVFQVSHIFIVSYVVYKVHICIYNHLLYMFFNLLHLHSFLMFLDWMDWETVQHGNPKIAKSQQWKNTQLHPSKIFCVFYSEFSK